MVLSESFFDFLDNIYVVKLPSSLRTRRKDFSGSGMYAEPHEFHRLWFEFLLLSPSYELARRYRATNGQLSSEDSSKLPSDFDHVLEVFDDFGDIQRSFFRPWLVKRGLELFGTPGAKPQTKLLCKLTGNDQSEIEKVGQSVQNYLAGDWRQQNRPDVLFLALPTKLRKQDLMRELKKIVDANVEEYEPPSKGKYKLATKGMHRQNVIDALSVLYVRAARPDFKLWQVGVEAKVSETYSKLFDSKTTKRNANNATDFRILEMMTSRKLRLAKHLVENAARGRFPDQSEPEHWVDFDPKLFKEIISARNLWKKEAMKKYK